jgi:hypothetical protein
MQVVCSRRMEGNHVEAHGSLPSSFNTLHVGISKQSATKVACWFFQKSFEVWT